MRFPRLLLFCATLTGLVTAIAAPAPAIAQQKSSVKAALVYNIMRFIEFPGDPRSLRVCGLSSDDTAGDLRRLEGRTVSGATIEVRLYDNASEIGSSCNVIYLDRASPRNIGSRSAGQVLIGSASNFAENGGTVGLISFGGQIRFVINDGAARRADVRFSSQLLQLAAKVL